MLSTVPSGAVDNVLGAGSDKVCKITCEIIARQIVLPLCISCSI